MSWGRELSKSRQEVIVGLVAADPEPIDIAALPARHGAVISSDLRSPDLAFACEAQRGMEWIFAKEAKLFVRERADLFGQLAVAIPE